MPSVGCVARLSTLCGNVQMMFKRMIAERLVVCTTPDGKNALRTVLNNKSVDDSTRRTLTRLLPR